MQDFETEPEKLHTDTEAPGEAFGALVSVII
jgi:hypothetical protein